jgi:uncharacterized cupredoxin-like copper-binding protein
MLKRISRPDWAPPFLALVVTLMVPLSTALAQQQQQPVSLTATDAAITPKTVTLTVGQPVQLTIRNTGRQDHNLVSDIPISNVNYIKADNDPAKLADYTARNVLDIDYKVDNTSTMMFTPTRTGSFEFHSEEQPGDQAAGMVGSFEVRAAGAAGPSQLPSTGDAAPDPLLPWIFGAAALLIGVGVVVRRLARSSRLHF